MKIGPPRFWTIQTTTPQARLLSPLSAITRRISGLRERRIPAVVDVPVLCCGNLTLGGAGKTTLALDLGQRLIDEGYHPHFLSRGYRASERGPLQVDPIVHSARQVGDEPLLLAQVAPTWIGADRSVTAQSAIAAGADCLIMDDGLQNRSLHQDVRVVTIDGSTGFGNGRIFPAGPLRESAAHGLARASAAVIIGPDRMGIVDTLPSRLPWMQAELIPGPEIRRLLGRRVIAFAGIARPSKFFTTLTDAGVQPLRCLSFPDHHSYTEKDCQRLAALRLQKGVTLVTTQKDAVRLPHWLREDVTTISIELRWINRGSPDALFQMLHLSP